MSSATIRGPGCHQVFREDHCLDGFNLVAEPGEVVALLGPERRRQDDLCSRRLRRFCALMAVSSSWRATMPDVSRPQ